MAELTLDAAQAAGLDRIGVALSVPIRRQVLVSLLDGPARPSELAQLLETSRSNLSNHLACLRGCGLIRAERDGRNLFYRLTSDDFAFALRTLITMGASLDPCQDHLP